MDVHLDDAPVLGVPFTGLMQVAIYDQDQRCHILRSSIEGRNMFFEGKLDESITVVLIVAAEVISTAKIPCIRAVEATRVFPKPSICLQNLSQVVEVCSGMGCLGVGLAAAGFDVKVRSDVNDRMLHLATKLGNGATLKGDVCSDQLLADLSQFFSEAQTLAAGVACQPYSRLGDQRHQHDPRAQTLPGVLRLGFLGVYGMIVLECVQEALSCAWVQQLLQRFSNLTGYKVTQGVLNLQHVWPARRTRWWCILTHPSLGQIQWEPLPRLNPVPIVADLLDQFQRCDEETYNQLLLDLYELGRFDAQGFEHNEVTWQGQMATSLHSCGNQLMGCPCGCRQYAFTDQRLQQGGLHGLLIKVEGTSQCGQKIYPNHRHISPDELALLNGMFPGIQWGVHARMALCALGQMASPIQSCWVGALTMKHLHQHFGLPNAIMPNEVLCKLLCKLLQARDSVFGLQQGPNCKAFQPRIEQELIGPIPSDIPEVPTVEHAHVTPYPIAAQATEVSRQGTIRQQPGKETNTASNEDQHMQPPTFASEPGRPPVPPCTVESAKHTADHADGHPAPADSHQPGPASEPGWPLVPPGTAVSAENTANQTKHHPVPVALHAPKLASEPGWPPEPPCTVGQAVDPNAVRPSKANAIKNIQLSLDQLKQPVTQQTDETAAACKALQSKAWQHTASEPGRYQIAPCPVEQVSIAQSSQDGADAATKFAAPRERPDDTAEPMHKQLKGVDILSIEQRKGSSPMHASGMPATPDEHNASSPASTPETQQKKTTNIVGQLPTQAAKVDRRDASKSHHATSLEEGEHTIPNDFCSQQLLQPKQRTGNNDVPAASHKEPQGQESLQGVNLGSTMISSTPGMLATPGEHNASGTKPAILANKDQAMHPGQPHESITKVTISQPGMLATPGQHNASPSLPGEAAHQQAILAQQAGLSSSRLTINQPGMLATPGHHNASLMQPATPGPPTYSASQLSKSSGNTHQLPPAPITGGVMGFESGKRISKSNEDLESQSKRAKTCNPPIQSSLAEPEGQPDHHDVAERGNETSQPARTDLDESPIDANTAKQQIQVWIIHEHETAPKTVAVTQGTTAGQITLAETKLHAMTQPIAVRSWVNSVVPLYEPVHDKQFLRLCQNMDMPRCPFLSGKCTAPAIEFPCPRIHALWAQQAFVAVDEMDFYLQAAALDAKVIAFPAKHFSTEAAVTTECQEWIRSPIQALDHHTTWVSAAIINHHWIPIMLSRTNDTISVTTTPEGSILLDQIAQETHLQGLALDVTQTILPQSFAADCGFQSFAWIMARLGQDSQEALTPEKAVGWRYLFAASLLAHKRHLEIIYDLPLGGTNNDPEVVRDLSQLLAQHGVMHDRIQDRVDLIMNRIPVGTLRAVLTSKKAWADLKHAANQTKPITKLIMQDELALQIAARASHRKQYGRKSDRPTKRGEPKKDNLPIAAKELQVPHGVFKQQDGQLLGPLGADQVGPNASGVVIIDQDDADALLRIPTPVSQHGLAVIVLANQANATAHEIDATRFPVVCMSTQEPLIVAGYIYQLGAQHVQRHEPESKIAVDEQHTEVFRCLVFHDQAGKLWEDLQSHPVKTVFASEPILRVKDHQDSPIVDVWDRQWLSKRFEKVKAHNADIFAFNFRLITEDPEELIARSGSNGIYYEPRSACGRFPNGSYHVTWLQNATFQDAKYAQQTSPQSTSLARHGDRYGLRSDTMNAQEIHTKHRPDVPLLLGQSKKMYAIGPLPYSTTKSAIHKLLKAWQWEGRPIQPKGRSQDGTGITWAIQATEDPSHWVFTLQHGDVLVTKLKEDKPVDMPAPYSIVASRKTLQHLQANATNAENADPWLAYDPWKQASQSKTSTQPVTQSLTTSQIAAIENNIEKKVLQAMSTRVHSTEADVNMDSQALESRVQQLESHLQHVQNVQSCVEAKVGQIEQQVHQVQVSQHGVESTIGQLQQKLDQQSLHMGRTLDAKLAEQMDKIEALLCKRGRHE